MKVLSLKQPYAELILQGKKTIEIRKWRTSFRGEFLIHSSKIPDAAAMQKFNFNSLPNGFILGKAKLIDVKEYKDEKDFLKDKELHLADFSFGRFGFILEEVQRIKPIEAKGNLNFWNYSFNEVI